MLRVLLAIYFVLTAVLSSLLYQGHPLRPDEASAQQADLYAPRYFESTRFWVQGPFREYWETHGGLFVFGYPITSVFMAEDGLYKQYFERAIFEYHPTLAGTQYQVLLQRLGAMRLEGREAEEPFVPLKGVAPDENCAFYTETGHRLCFGLRDFWKNNGGLPNFGYPLSEEFDERNAPPPAGDGEVYTVQYFERARIEWHPQLRGTKYEFLLGLLGTEYLLEHGAPDNAVEPQSPDVAPEDPTVFWWDEPEFRYGFNIAWDRDEGSRDFNERTIELVEDAGFGAVRIQALWSQLEPERGVYRFDSIERILSIAERNRVRVLVSIVRAPHWAVPPGEEGIPVDTAPFEDFMREISGHFGGRVDGWEIWNEQNLAFETGGYVDAGRYVELLKAGYRGAKAGYPLATIVFGGLTPTGVNDPTVAIDDVNYLQQVYAYNGGEVKNYYDVLGTHPGSNNNAPDQSWPDNPGSGGWTDHQSFYFRRVEGIRAVMVANGEGHKPVWLTEFGWSSSDTPAPGQEFAADNTEQEQAQFLTRAYEIARTEWPWMQAMFVWNLNFWPVVEPGDHKGYWGVLNPDWSPRPAYNALKSMPK